MYPVVPGLSGGVMQPYYERDGVTIYHGDCREVLPTLPRGSVDLLLTDPPYGVNWQSGRRGEAFALIAGDDGSLDVLGALTLALRALRVRRHLYIFGPADLSRLPVTGVVELIWDKGCFGSGNLAQPWAPQHERIQFAFSESRPGSQKAGAGNLSARLRRGSIIRVQRPSGVTVKAHPTEKPVELLRILIESSSLMGETVLDPFAGSGSTLVAALLEGRQAIGIEIEERYCEVAAKRLSQQVLPLEVSA